MENKELIAKISLLKGIKPQDEWVFLKRQELLDKKTFPLPKKGFWGIFEDIERVFRLYLEKPALVMSSLAVAVFVGAVWHISTNSLPGDVLYPVKTAAQQVPLTFSSEDDRPFLQIELAQKRLEDVKRVVETNKGKNLSSAIKVFEANVEEASKSLAEIVENQPERALQASRGVVQLQKEKSAIEQILGTKIGKEQEEAFESTTKLLVENELSDLETRSLTEEQQELLKEAQDAYEQEDYQEALTHIWNLLNNNEG